jgi:hypothetical protein
VLFPRYISDGNVFVCPAATGAEAITAQAIEGGPVPAEAFASRHTDYGYVSGLAANGGPTWVLAFDARAENHQGEGRHVLYLAGTVKRVSEAQFRRDLETTLRAAKAKGFDAKVICAEGARKPAADAPREKLKRTIRASLAGRAAKVETPPEWLKRWAEARVGGLSVSTDEPEYNSFLRASLATRFGLDGGDGPRGRAMAQWRGRRGGGEVSLYSLFTGGAAIRESMQLDRALDLMSGEGAHIPIGDVQAVQLKDHPFDQMRKGRPFRGSPLAKLCPRDAIYARVRSLTEWFRVKDLFRRWGGSFLSTVRVRGTDHRTFDRYAEQLALGDEMMARLVGTRIVGEFAVVATDPLFLEGTGVAVLFAPQRGKERAMAGLFDAQRAARALTAKGASQRTLTVEGVRVQLLSSPDGLLRSYGCVIGTTRVFSNSEELLARIIRASRDEGRSLHAAADYRYYRSLYPLDEVESGFVYLSQEWFRRITGPAWRIARGRRRLARWFMRDVRFAWQTALQEGARADIKGLTDAGLVSLPGGTSVNEAAATSATRRTFVQPPARTGTSANEAAAIRALRTYLGAQNQYHRSDFYGKGALSYANPKDGKGFPDLYRVRGKGEVMNLIDASFARATGPESAKRGYYFVDLQYGDYTVDCGLCAVPARYGETGFYTFVIDVTGTVYAKDNGGKPLTTYPDMRRASWVPAQTRPAPARPARVRRPARPSGGRIASRLDLKLDPATGAVTSGTYGPLALLRPVDEFLPDRVGGQEKEIYDRFRQEYTRYWRRYIDPVGIRLRASKTGLEAETLILPLIKNSIYEQLRELVGGPVDENARAVPLPDDALGALTLNLSMEQLNLGEILGELVGMGYGRELPADPSWFGRAVTVGVADGDLLVTASAEHNELVGELFGELGGNAGQSLIAASAISSILLPTFTAIEVHEPKAVEQFLEGVWRQAQAAPRGGFSEFRVLKYQTPHEPRIHTVTFTLFVVDIRVHYAFLGRWLLIATKPGLLKRWIERIAEAGGDAGGARFAENGRLTVRPGAFKEAREAIGIAWQERVVNGCHANLVPLGRAAEAGWFGRAEQFLGYRALCPGGGKYSFEGGTIRCGVHGVRAPRVQPLKPPGRAPAVKLINSMTDLTVEFRFTEDGLRSRVNVSFQPARGPVRP